VILDREIAPLSSSFRRDNIVIAAVSGNRSTIFFFSSCLFAAGWVSQLALDIFYPVPLAVLNELRSSGPAMLLGTAYFGTVLFGLVLFIFGMGSLFVEACGFKRKVEEFGVPAFTEYGIECLKQIIADERAAGTAPPKVRSTE
jgi:hypothetical protein